MQFARVHYMARVARATRVVTGGHVGQIGGNRMRARALPVLLGIVYGFREYASRVPSGACVRRG